MKTKTNKSHDADTRDRRNGDYDFLSTNENDLLNHICMWGSAAYPIQKLSAGKWMWREFFGIKGAPVVYRTKKAAVEAFEKYMDILRDRCAGRLAA